MNFNSIRLQVIAVIIIGALVGTVLIEFAWTPRMNALLIDTQSLEVEREAEILADGILPYLLSNQIGAVYETLQSVKDRYDSWIEVTLHSEDGHRIFPFGELQNASGAAIVTETVQIAFQGKDLGVLSVVVDLGPGIERFRTEQLRMVYVAAVIVALILFGVELELDIATAASVEARPPQADTQPTGRQRSALVVDDSEINLTVASAMLQSLGFDVDTADNGLSALVKAQQKKFDVIFMDMHMPEMDGLEATRRIRDEDGPNAETRIIALTASVQQDDIDKCKAAGMNAFMPKPLRLDRLKDVLIG